MNDPITNTVHDLTDAPVAPNPAPAANPAALGNLLRENEALADEILRSYEQLNLIFDVTGQMAALNDPCQLKHLLCERLRISLNARDVWCVGQPSPGDPFDHCEASVCGDGLLPAERELSARPLIEAVRSKQKVLVRTMPLVDPREPETQVHIMAGPLRVREDSPPLILCAMRGQSDFTSADVLLFDSVLAYAGHILRNLHLVERLKRTSFETVRALVNAIDQKDRYTCGHSERVGILARMTGQQMGLAPEQIQELEWAGLLHDIGKIGIPETILNKPGRLTPEEYDVVKQHPQMSHEVLKPIKALAGVMQIVIEHHENHDGTGYPRGLRGEEISLAGRIMHVVDVFDALTSHRSYRPAYDLDQALAILRQDAGTKLDPLVVDTFGKVLERIRRLRPAEFQELFGPTAQETAR